ncbi:MAG: restriction endonuclease [Chloroflexi bacterium]|nr:restriction endonuclease [Chloroflexota bacterium]
MAANTLYYGDNLDILRRYIDDESVDLIYLDPPFNSSASYNVLFREPSGEGSAAQIKAFEDTWTWGDEAELAYRQLLGSPLASAMTKEIVSSLRKALGDRNAMTAYLVMMAVRLVELRRVLKPTGSLYLHCDPTASHYLKVVLDSIFGKENFRNEIAWQRTGAHNDAKRYGAVSDRLLFYSKSNKWTWNPQYTEYTPEYIKERYHYVEESSGRLFWPNQMTGAGQGPARMIGGQLREPPSDRHWAYTQEDIDRLETEGRIYWSTNGAPYIKNYLDERKGRPLQDVWTDVVMTKSGQERLGYPTQKPLALLERIIQASSNEGEVVLDPFCGCGTAVAAAHKLDRRWIGIDITHLAIALMKSRMKDMFNLEPKRDYQVVGEPVDAEGARQLWLENHYQFQYWAVSLLTGQPRQQDKKGADRGIDGVIFFLDGPRRSAHKAIIQVKGGHVTSSQIRDLKGVLEREGAALGLFITLEDSTRDMRVEAASAGLFRSDLMERDYPRVQIRTVAELLEGRGFEMPLRPAQFKQAERVRRPEGKQGVLPEADVHP